MSEHGDYKLSDEGRALVLEAAQLAVDGLDHSAGGVVTGYILVVESVGQDGNANLTWVSGNGMPTEDGEGGLARWRLIGMLEDVVTQAQAAIWRWRLRGEE